jgi:membrane-bound lytic murein transglycosylase D
MEAVRAALMTQTAQAMSGVPLGPELTPTPSLTPVVVVSSATPTPSPTPATGLTPLPTFTRGPAAGTVDYTVQEGDWLYGIANKFGVDPQQIIDLNNLTPPYTLAIGQVLKIPGQTASTSAPPAATPVVTQVASGTKYTVQEGEWVYSIARKFGVDPYAIIEANNLQSPYTLYPGQVLVIP